MKRAVILVCGIVLFSHLVFADVFNPLGTENCELALDRQTGFIVMSSSALVSFLASELVSDVPHLDFYQFHSGYYYGESGSGGAPGAGTSSSENYSIVMENFGVEREFSPWFSMLLEANLQEMFNGDYFSMGIGLKPYFRWTLFRQWMIHPYIEYGAGVFYAFSKFPADGSNFTFNLNYAVGLEYIFADKDKLRLDFNFKHQSNNNFFDANPGFDSNGISLSYCKYLRSSPKRFSHFWDTKSGE